MQFIISAVIVASSAMLIKLREKEINEEYKKNEEIDWNDYYAHY